MDQVRQMSLRIKIGKAIWLGNFMKQGYRDCMHLIMEYLNYEHQQVERKAILIIDDGGYSEKEDEEVVAKREAIFEKDISCILEDWLYLSGAIGAQSRALQAKYQVYDIISVGFFLSPVQKKNHDPTLTNYHFFPLEDCDDQPLEHILPQVLTILQDNFKARKKTLVHCQMGISRSASCIIAFLMQQNKSDYDTALKFVKDKRPCVCPNPGFENKLRRLISCCPTLSEPAKNGNTKGDHNTLNAKVGQTKLV